MDVSKSNISSPLVDGDEGSTFKFAIKVIVSMMLVLNSGIRLLLLVRSTETNREAVGSCLVLKIVVGGGSGTGSRTIDRTPNIALS